ncbi:MAG: hypothetical protein HDT27_02790 [Subdoligranulum sp.]|nr:hypothetical protein [Subdoligranulum sp.]
MRRRSKRSIIIELTALLDVILILIFLVMKENSALIAEKQQLLDALQQENNAQAGEIDTLNSEIGALNGEIGTLTARLNEALQQLQMGDREALANRLQAAESQLQSYQAVEDIVTVITIRLENNADNTVRCLTFGRFGALTELQAQSDAEFSTAVNRLRVFLTGQSRPSADGSAPEMICIVFTYDTDKVYQRDFAAIEGVLKDVAARADQIDLRYQFNQTGAAESKTAGLAGG